MSVTTKSRDGVDPACNLVDRLSVENVGGILRKAASIQPNALAVDWLGIRGVTYQELWSMSKKHANSIRTSGCGQGARVAIFSQNSVEFLASFFGTGLTGVILCTINYSLLGSELVSNVQDAEPSILFIGHRQLSVVVEVASQLTSVKQFVVMPPVNGEQEPSLPEGFVTYVDWVKDSDDSDPGEALTRRSDVFFICYTSGTTGASKGVVTTQEAWLCEKTHNKPVLPTFQRLIVTSACFHVTSMMFSLECLTYGGTVVLFQRDSSADEIASQLSSQASGIYVTPKNLVNLMQTKYCQKNGFGTVKSVILGGAYLAKADLYRFFALCPDVTVTNCYGLTESGPNRGTAIILSSALSNLDRLSTSIGKAAGCEIRIADDEGQVISEPDRQGEIQLKGPSMLKEYWKKPEKTQEVLTSDGWLHTGDMGHFDIDGNFYFDGRFREVIKLNNGQCISQYEVEQALAQSPLVHEVAVVAAPNTEFGEECRAIVVLTDPISSRGPMTTTQQAQAALLEHLAGHLAPFKLPQSFDFCERLPRSAFGKVDKLSLVRALWKGALPGAASTR